MITWTHAVITPCYVGPRVQMGISVCIVHFFSSVRVTLELFIGELISTSPVILSLGHGNSGGKTEQTTRRSKLCVFRAVFPLLPGYVGIKPGRLHTCFSFNNLNGIYFTACKKKCLDIF